MLRSLGFAPSPVQRMVSRLIASPRTFNLTVSNIPGPREPMYMRGCPLAEAYPVVPIADRHALSIGVTTVGDGAFFGLYADPRVAPRGRRARRRDRPRDRRASPSSSPGDRAEREPMPA